MLRRCHVGRNEHLHAKQLADGALSLCVVVALQLFVGGLHLVVGQYLSELQPFFAHQPAELLG